MSKRSMTVIVDDATIEQLDVLATAVSRSRSQYVNLVLQQYLRDQQHQQVPAAVGYEVAA